MKIDIWSDFGCLFCFIGKKRLEQALSQFPMGDKVEIVYHSYQLNPHAENRAISAEETAPKKGMTVKQLKDKQAQVARWAKSETGIDIDFESVITANTFDGHRLVHFAANSGKGVAMTERLMRAYLSDSMNIADREVLISLSGEVGLNEREAAEMLQSNAYKDQVHADIAKARNMNVTGVPFFLFNNKYAIPGAQSEEAFLETLHLIWDEEKQANNPEIQKEEAKGDGICTDGSCDL
ncbi:DsbA family protein [Paenibacillus sp. NPDC058071]|uniref:DsbA family oxidoreductase n=1 Tax=Paenibacillus sp. NPDC058071 TaxID=3346326 RepID=UPI0036DC7E55